MKIDWLTPEHHIAMIEMLGDVYRYYNSGADVDAETIEAHLQDNLLRPNAPFRLLVATKGHEIRGFAAVGILHSFTDPLPGKNAQCQLKELFVHADHRGEKIGEKLMQRVIEIARAEGCGRIDWHVKADNHAGIRFYQRFGAQYVEDRRSLRLDLNP